MFCSNIKDVEIMERIRDFREKAEAGIADELCVNAVSSIFGSAFSFGTETRVYEQGTTFYRVRPIPPDDTIIPLRTIRNLGDAWEPPSESVRMQGRLNAIGQGVLYCCPGDFELAIDEARARDSKHIAVIVYKSLRPVKVAVLGDCKRSSLSKDAGSKMFYSFLDEEFSRLVAVGEEGRYSITRAIADTYFNYPQQDAWCYRSVQSPEKFNVAFLPGKSKFNLQLVGVMICEPSRAGVGALGVKAVVEFDPRTGEALYHAVGSSAQKRIFPEIQ